MGRHAISARLGGWALSALAALGVCLVVPLAVDEASAKSRKHYRNSYYGGYYGRDFQRRQAEMERERREQERAMQRASEEARRSAERDARRMQSDYDRYQRRDQDWASRDADRSRQGERDGWRGRQSQDGERDTAEDQRRDATADGEAVSEEGNADDRVEEAGLTEQERRVRRLEQIRRRAVLRAEREQEAWRRKEGDAARNEDRLRKRHAKRLPTDPDTKVPTPTDDAGRDRGPPRGAERPPASGEDADRTPASGESESADRDPASGGEDVVRQDVTEPVLAALRARRVKWLDGLQQPASHLGMGRAREAGRAVRRQEKPAQEDALAAAGGPGPSAERGGGQGRRLRAGRVADVPFPGKELGAELPPDLYEKEREEELVVTGLSPVDLETAKLHGFTASAPTVLPGSGTKVQRLRAPGGGSRDAAERELHKILPFLSVTPNHAYTIYTGSLGEVDSASGVRPGVDRRKASPASPDPCPNDRCFGQQLIKWNPALNSCTRGVRIGIIDTSFDIGHPAFRHIRVEQGMFLEGEMPSPYDWHGTAVLSLLAGDPASGTPGLAPDATFLLATAFRSDAVGNASTDTVRLLAALAWLDELDVDVVNMSFSGPQDTAVARAIEDMRKKGVVFVAAAGNMGPTAAPSYPAAYPDVIAVTAVNRKGENYRQANRGTYIDVSAPGVDILTALPDSKQGYRTGTSFAAPFVTAIVATRGRAAPVEEASLGAAPMPILTHVSTRDLGPPGRDPIFGAGLALAPAQCPERQDEDAVVHAGPELDSWSSQTTLIKAGAVAP